MRSVLFLILLATAAIGARRSIAIRLQDAMTTALDLKPAFPGLAP